MLCLLAPASCVRKSDSEQELSGTFSMHDVVKLDERSRHLVLSTNSLDKSPENFPRMDGKRRCTSLFRALLDNRSARVGTTRNETNSTAHDS